MTIIINFFIINLQFIKKKKILVINYNKNTLFLLQDYDFFRKKTGYTHSSLILQFIHQQNIHKNYDIECQLKLMLYLVIH